MNKPINSARLRFVAPNFLTLQGLRQVALGVMLLLLIPALGFAYPWNYGLFVILLVSLGLAWWRIGIYYERTFGHVDGRTHFFSWDYGQVLSRRGLVLIAVVLISAASAMMFHMNLLLLPGWFFGMFFVGSYSLGNRPWYYLLFALPFFVLGILDHTYHHRFLVIELWVVPFAFIITGILDHLLLTRLLPGDRLNGTA